MTELSIKVTKRDGRIVAWSSEKIHSAVRSAYRAYRAANPAKAHALLLYYSSKLWEGGKEWMSPELCALDSNLFSLTKPISALISNVLSSCTAGHRSAPYVELIQDEVIKELRKLSNERKEWGRDRRSL
jgi:hypothetical protein